MTMAEQDSELETQIASWTQYLRRRRAVAGADVEELEGHLRDQVDHLVKAGLSEEEAFFVAIKRIGSLDEVSREYAREHSDRLWKQLVIDDSPSPARSPRTFVVVAGLAVGAAVAMKIPALFGVTFSGDPEFYGLNAGLLVLPFLAAYFAWTRRVSTPVIVIVAAAFAMTAVILNVYPFTAGGMTVVLAAIAALVVLWLAVGVAYAGGLWRSDTMRMDFIRFTGEWVVYYTLIALGGAVLVALTMGVFGAIGLDAGRVVEEWIIPCGVAGAVVVAAGLVEAKQSVIENIAPVLTKLFTPLFTAMLLALVVAALIQRDLLETSRDLLIIFDVVLIVVLGLLLYSLSARDPETKPGWFERLQLVMVSSAIVVDVLVLIAMVATDRSVRLQRQQGRVARAQCHPAGQPGVVGVPAASASFAADARPAQLEKWQTGYIPVYLAWALVVMIVFPPVFAFT